MRVRCLAAGALALGLGFASVPARAQTFVTVLTGGTSGVYYPLGVALSKIFAEKVPNIRPTVQATKASVENLNLLQQGRARSPSRSATAWRSPGWATRRRASAPNWPSCAA